ncbi:hypothetical protein CWO90_24330 [Bradyrhizobium sp. Leo121]|jgi:hypothetical protein|nr:hypothetical protein CWO90_24330 [Bradyrhizobium sp. Leo121]
MGRRWSDLDVDDLKRMARRDYPAQSIARMLHRSPSGVIAKAHELKISLQSHHRLLPRGFKRPRPRGFPLT